ncbi:MAG: PstS family phosphate ABC transporter substrate-binding protein [Chloroflexi bacterium]|nr:PstS family phosphate ABC transporter substrate-binding protein [Chloroflexota bacterium]MBT3669420.1 PstS family phosphate ABC transporter substrate-binding protein [Chloroflexota bacterium]MBT4003983.1 PstS family phosphate ABC transporter substrate-binding protein [Chloroflexota bacterium]MBT4304561.1 PstS family phosphate ABC transporter substrate-binding protein [Chloroflexota bacterium]MBT4534098.1 PstS family phosphate ABC transporter substrate-binding protein [Chloroflexota bacterium
MVNKKIIILLILLFTLPGCSGSNSNSPSSNSSESQIYIENKGSDTIVNLALAWAEEYQNIHPNISLSVTGGGSGTGIAALINNTVDIANASRSIKDKEIENANENNVEPLEFVIARDAIAVIINPENPVEKLSLQQISDIYSGKFTNWSEVGGEDRPIVRLSRETNSGTHVYFLEQVLRLGDKENPTFFSPLTLLLPSSEGIISEVSQNPNAIGYDGLGYITDEVKVVGVSQVGSTEYIYPSVATVNSGEYPIARDLYMYTNGQPVGEIEEYLNWIFSEAAQEIVAELGFVPIIK